MKHQRSTRLVTNVAEEYGLQTHADRGRGLHRSWALLCVNAAAAGLLVIALGYAAGRDGNTFLGNGVFWCGYALVVLPIVVGLSRIVEFSQRDSLIVLWVLTVASFATKWMYSPLLLKFRDELQHLRGLQNAEIIGHVGATNDSLTVAHDFPGLSSVGLTVANATHLAAEPSTFVVAVVLHVFICVSVYLLFHMLLRTPRAVAIAFVAYSANSGFLSYSSDYVYENLAFPFFIIGLIAAINTYRRPDQARRWFACALVAELFCLVAHHITAIALAAVLLIVGTVELSQIRRPRNRYVIAQGLLVPVLCAAWLIWVTSSFSQYVSTYLSTISIHQPAAQAYYGNEVTSIGSAPVLNIAFALAAVAIICLSVILGFMNYSKLPIEHIKLPLLIFSSFIFIALGARALLFDGSEVLVRSEPFIYCAAAVVFAGLFDLRYRANQSTPRLSVLNREVRGLTPRSPTFAIVAVVLLVGGVCGAWPAWWLRVPQGLVEDGFERGVDAHINNAAEWVNRYLPPGGRIAADINGEVALSTRGGQQPVANVGLIFYTPTINEETRLLLQREGVDYVWVDSRLPRLVSASGAYFPGVQMVTVLRPSLPTMNKFADAPGVSKVYADGTIAIYDVRALK
jgi:hypothetical protein